MTQPIKITPQELKSYCKRTKINKAPGPYGISNFTLKKLRSETLQSTTDIFNACSKLQYFAQTWKKVTIVVFQKPRKDPTPPSSYRLISLLNTLSKALEAMFLGKYNAFPKANYLIRKKQFGFQQGHLTTHQILRLTEHITKRLNW